MRFYDLMTAFWAVLWAAIAAYATYSLADSDRRTAMVLGVIAGFGMIVAVVCWRAFKDPR